MARWRNGRGWMLGGLLTGALAAWTVVSRARARGRFRGRVVVIAGGSRGLGLALAEAFAECGARLVLIGRDAETLVSARAQLLERFGEAIDVALVTADLADSQQISRAAREATEPYGAVDVLVNNAGTIQVGPFASMREQDLDDALALHVYAPLRLTRALLPALRLSPLARVVNIASIGGIVSVPHLLAYSTSKFGLVGLSEGLTAALRADGVTVTTVCPGLMRTGSPAHAFFRGRKEAEYAWFKIVDSLPVLTMAARQAARRVVTACARGQAHVALSWTTRAAEIAHGLFPNLTVSALTLAHRALPAPGGIGDRSIEGRASESRSSASWLTRSTDAAARRWNQ